MKLEAIMQNLAVPVPANKVGSKTVKNNKTGETSQIKYISWYNLVDLLNERCGFSGWEWTIKNIMQSGDVLVMVGSLTIHGDDRSITREATGQESVKVGTFGDSSSNAEAMAIRRCCAKFGLGIDLWRKSTGIGGGATKAPTPLPTAKGELTKEQWLARQRGN
jgi:hypothetical protein